MKVFADPRCGAMKPRFPLGARISEHVRRVASQLAAMNGRIDEARACRDRANQAGHTVDGAFWVFLR
jgi:hypothetical protein